MFTLNCKGRLLAAERPLVMGIINVTDDSFYTGSRQQGTGAVLKKAAQMLAEGADILDIGGQSTRPGSTLLNAEAECTRVVPAIEALAKEFPEAILSVDTFYAAVAQKASDAGAHIINDISAGELDKKMIATVASLRTPYVCMHMKGTPQTMQSLAEYSDVTKEVLDYFIKKAGDCKQAGIHDVIIDPGFGFSKTITHNFQLLKNMQVLSILQLPILVGLSRKSTIYKTLNISAEEALNGTTVLHTLALQNGAGILRVHDVKEAREAITLFSAYKNA